MVSKGTESAAGRTSGSASGPLGDREDGVAQAPDTMASSRAARSHRVRTRPSDASPRFRRATRPAFALLDSWTRAVIWKRNPNRLRDSV
jgi:hypothetical protein